MTRTIPVEPPQRPHAWAVHLLSAIAAAQDALGCLTAVLLVLSCLSACSSPGSEPSDIRHTSAPLSSEPPPPPFKDKVIARQTASAPVEPGSMLQDPEGSEWVLLQKMAVLKRTNKQRMFEEWSQADRAEYERLAGRLAAIEPAMPIRERTSLPDVDLEIQRRVDAERAEFPEEMDEATHAEWAARKRELTGDVEQEGAHL